MRFCRLTVLGSCQAQPELLVLRLCDCSPAAGTERSTVPLVLWIELRRHLNQSGQWIFLPHHQQSDSVWPNSTRDAEPVLFTFITRFSIMEKQNPVTVKSADTLGTGFGDHPGILTRRLSPSRRTRASDRSSPETNECMMHTDLFSIQMGNAGFDVFVQAV
ncbi:unnamed protein product, partial [Nesidiocoris tenuis]